MVHTRAGLASATEYIAGKQAAAGGPAVRLAANESPFPPLDSVLEAIRSGLDRLNRYPEPAADALRAVIAGYHDVTTNMVAVGPGAGAICERAVLATCGPGSELVFAQPSFIGYSNYASIAAATPVRVPLDAAMAHDLDAMLARVSPRTGAVIVCNPNNPTATAVGHDALRGFLDRVPSECLVVVDEAYLDFADDSAAQALDLVPEYENLLVLRTFSKAHGLAGLRAGYAIGQTATIRVVNRARSPFQINSLGQLAAIASLTAGDELAARVGLIRQERLWLSSQLDRLGVPASRSQANFVWLPMSRERGADVAALLESAGVLVRPFDGGVRITIGTRAENERLVAALGDTLGR